MNTKNKVEHTLLYKLVKKREKELGYKGCKNCVNQIAPLRMCEWAEKGGARELHFICPNWIKKNE